MRIDSDDELITDGQAQAAKSKLLEAKALYSLRNKIVEDVLVANPVLQAVHAGNKATLIERFVSRLKIISQLTNNAGTCFRSSSHEMS